MKYFRLFLCLVAISSLACTMTAVPAAISASPQNATRPPFSSLQNAPKMPTATIYHSAAVIALEALNIRTGPGIQFGTIGYLLTGASVTVFECAGDWARIGAGRWVNSYYLSVRCKLSGLRIKNANQY